MRKDFDTTAHQKNRVADCDFCKRLFYESLLRECPEQEGRIVCAYCCRLCRESYQDGTVQGCRAADAVRSKKKRGAA